MPINTSQVTDTLLAAAVAGKHIQNQNEGTAVSSLNQLGSAQEHVNLKQAQYNELKTQAKEAESAEPMANMEADYEQATQNELDAQKAVEQATANVNGRSRDPVTGRFESKEKANERLGAKMDELTAAQKAKSDLATKIEARQNLLKEVKAKQGELNSATKTRDIAQETFNKYKKYLPGGKK